MLEFHDAAKKRHSRAGLVADIDVGEICLLAGSERAYRNLWLAIAFCSLCMCEGH